MTAPHSANPVPALSTAGAEARAASTPPWHENSYILERLEKVEDKLYETRTDFFDRTGDTLSNQATLYSSSMDFLGIWGGMILLVFAALGFLGYTEIKKHISKKVKEEITDHAKQPLEQLRALETQYKRLLEDHASETIKRQFDELLSKARFEYNQKRWVDCIKPYQQAIAFAVEKNKTQEYFSNEQIAECYFYIGVAKGALGQHEQAIDDFTLAIQHQPDDAAAYYNRGVAKAKLGQLDEAIEDYTLTIQHQPDDAAAYHNRGVAKQKLGQHDEAIADYSLAIQHQPDYAQFYFNKAYVYELSNKPIAETLALLRKSIELDQSCKEKAKTANAFTSLRDNPEFKALVGL
jgi:tetratricopeptide (TPR) repeat protein